MVTTGRPVTSAAWLVGAASSVFRARGGVDGLAALVPQRTDLAGGQRGERGRGGHDARTAPVLLGEPQEVAGEGAQACLQRLDECVLLAGRQQRVGGFLPADGGGALRAGRR